ncbi:integrase [Gordonia phage DelRio]|nr:integrase [Gordonia phage DelRio]
MARPPMPIGTWGKIKREEIAAGRWQASARYRDYDGLTRKVKRFGKTGAAAERALLEALRDRAKPTTAADEITRDTTIADLAQLWIDKRVAEDNLSDGTLDNYRDLIRVHIVPGLGGVRVGEATVGRLDKFIRAIPGTTSSRHCRVVLSGMMTLAAQHDAVDRNPVRDTTIRTEQRKPTRAMTLDELQRLRIRIATWSGSNNAGPKRGLDVPDLFDVIAGTGTRIGEILAIRWQDIAWPQPVVVDGVEMVVPGTLTVCGTINKRGERQPWTKSHASHRILTLPDFAIAALRRQQARELPTDQDLVFPSRSGGPRTTHNTRRQLRDARRLVVVRADGQPDGAPDEFEWVTPHVFRKTVATIVENENDMETAAGQLGHASPDITRVHYVQRAAMAPDVRNALNLLAPVARIDAAVSGADLQLVSAP